MTSRKKIKADMETDIWGQPHNSKDMEREYLYTGRGSVPTGMNSGVARIRFHGDVISGAGDREFLLCLSLRVVVFNEGLETINEASFNQTSLEHIICPSTLIEIDNLAFCGCKNLSELVLNEGLQRIGKQAFNNCISLESISIPSTVTYINDMVFSGCCRLRELVFNNGLQNIGFSAFSSCASLESIQLPSSLTKIGRSSFSNCSNLRSVTMSEGIQRMERSAFKECPLLNYIKFPSLSARVDYIIRAGHTDIEMKLDINQGGLERREGEIVLPTARMNSSYGSTYSSENQATEEVWGRIRTSIDRMVAMITYYELKEVTTILELALWKCMIGQAQSKNRSACRIEVPGPVKDTILQYIG